MRKFLLGQNAVKNTVYIEKCFKQKLRKIQFPQKNSVDTYVYLPQEWRGSGGEGGSKDLYFLNKMHRNGRTFTSI